ncbi:MULTISPECIES: AraC family transcriptional regulator [Sphingomonadales]|uniref:HTH-type transcriptional activator RhaS n=1 Tax=Edaphosphingomonas haloaromaticamans TaxID=653954 RepID=A0A1S1HFN1_9SPHN|nr:MULTISPECIES: AraC family transcriptional regulator [Sphingomonas]AGH48559.1 transcriptional regulator [Sphingomonas sp. MM-1]MDX3883263.1 AraC family transcriptional regulator [Sphingomonas sp.]OHT21035.1 HTH-type transcriptional activator RhaS [Sphingomonas haloaromaticamans]
MRHQLDQMLALAERHLHNPHREAALPRLALYASSGQTCSTATLYRPMLCLVLQGAKQVLIGDRVLRYDPASYFVASLELPASGRIVEASPDRPYVALSLTLDREALAALLPDAPPASGGRTAGFAVSPVTPHLLDACLRLLALLDTPEDAAVLAPLHEREILYRLLRGPQGGVLRQIAQADSRLSQVRQAIAWIREHFDEPLRVEALAEIAGMSPASFHRHFKAATAMSPLQYQKVLRLQEARRLLVISADATRAAYRVGYESASQFSREYARMFGVPPSRDAERLRGAGIGLPEISSAA